jgi:hypothetical protein
MCIYCEVGRKSVLESNEMRKLTLSIDKITGGWRFYSLNTHSHLSEVVWTEERMCQCQLSNSSLNVVYLL